MSRLRAIWLQRNLNRFTRDRVYDVTPIRADGDMGPATKKRIREVKFWLGYKRKNIGGDVDKRFRKRLKKPTGYKGDRGPWVERGARRRIWERRAAKRNRRAAGLEPDVGFFDGKPVALILVPHLTYARNQGWKGSLTSGWRDPEYSEHLCIIICGHPTCPGKCAGKSSNHVGTTADRCAIDVSDYARFGQLMNSCPASPRIHNALGATDPVHFSPSGR